MAYEIRGGRVRSAAAALREIEQLSQTRAAAIEILDTLRAEYAQMVESAEKQLRSLTMSAQQLQEQELYRIRRHLLDTERDQVIQAFRQGGLGPKSQETLLADIDARVVSLETSPAKFSIPPTPSANRSSAPHAGDPAARIDAEGQHPNANT